jgi:asparagine synthase (glutamine-hydrolysing)
VAPGQGTDLETILHALDEPLADDSVLPTWALAKVVGARFKVALTGIGGDELFAGYRRHTGMVAGAWYARAPRWLRRWLASGAHAMREPRNGALGLHRVKRFLAANGRAPAERFLEYVSRLADAERQVLYAPALRDHVARPAAHAWFAAVHARGGKREGVGAALFLDYQTYLPDDILALSDRIAMAHSLEVRVPLVDHVLIERVLPFVLGAPLAGLRRKHLLRQAVRDRLPPGHLRAPKRGFVGPTGAWLRAEWRTLLLDELSDERMKRLGYFDPGVVRRLLDEHLRGRHNREGILWGLLCFSIWHRQYVESSTAPVVLAAAGI